MPIISGFTLIRTLSILHLTLAFYFLASPRTLSDQNLVFILGEAMGLPHTRELDTPSAPASLLAMMLALLGLSDMVAVSLPEEVSRYFWASQTPIRLMFFFILTAYTYLFKPGGVLANPLGNYTPSAGEGLKNSIVFTWAFVEMISWFWIYTTLRDERKDAAIRLMKARKQGEDSL